MSQDELKQEEKVEEKQSEVKEDINDMLPGAEPINKPEKDARDYGEVVEEARLAFMKKYKAGRRNSYIAMGVVMLLAIGSVICITMSVPAVKIVGWVLVGVAVVGMLIFYILTRNSLPKATKDYIKVVNDQFNIRNFSDTRFSDVSTDKNEKFELADPVSDSVYNGLNNIASRNVINGKFDGRSFKAGDLGLYSGSGRQRTSAFVGKYIKYPNDLHFEGRYVLVSKGKTPVDQPNYLDDLVPLVEDDTFVIYGKAGNTPKSDLTQRFIDFVKKIEIDEFLLNLNIVVWGGASAAYASYSDQVMTLPYQDVFDKKANEEYAKDLLDILNALSLLVKKEK